MIGVTFGDKHSYDDFGIVLTDVSIGTPEPKTETVDIPGMDGELDLSQALTGTATFKTRAMELIFAVPNARSQWASVLSDVSNYLHGQSMRVILDDDASYYYYGRLTVDKYTSNINLGTLVIKGTVNPYKVDLNSTSETDDWLWDPFSFEDGVIYTGSVTVDGETTVNLITKYGHTCPTFTCSSSMTVTFDGTTYDLESGSEKIIDIQLAAGDNYLTFDGDGTVEISYESRSL